MGARRGRRTHDRRRRHSRGRRVVGAGRAARGRGARLESVRGRGAHRRDIGANAGGGQGPTVAIIHLAMVQGAVYDAVNSIDGGHAPYLDDIPAAPASASKPAAAATAAHHVLVGTVMAPPLSAGIVTRLNGLYADSLAALPDGVAKTAGIAAGAAAATKMLSERAAEVGTGRSGSRAARMRGSGVPRRRSFVRRRPAPNDPNAWVARVEPFVLESTSQFRSRGGTK